MHETEFTIEKLKAMPLAWDKSGFNGKVVMISGAGSGIGRAAAITLARLGAHLVLTGRKKDTLNETASACQEFGADCLVQPASIRSTEEITALFNAADEKFGGIDALINNAGGQFSQAAIDFSENGWKAVIDTNLNGTWFMMQEAAKRWIKSGRKGSITNVVVVVKNASPGMAHTVAARAGVIAVSQNVAVEWATHGIRVNCVAPGIIASSGMQHYTDHAKEMMPKSNPQRRFGTVMDIANSLLFLLGPTGDFITGETLTVDGGGQIFGRLATIPWGDVDQDW